MSIRWTVFLGCSLFVAIILALGVFTRAQETSLGQLATDLYDNALVGVSSAQTAETDFVRLEERELRSPTPFSGESARAAISDLLDDVDVARERAISGKGEALAARVRNEIGKLRRPVSRSAYPAILAAIERDFDDLVIKYRDDGFVYRSRADRIIARADTWLLIAVAIAALSGIAITMVLGELIVPPIGRAVEIAAAIAGGKLDNRIEASGRSETSRLLDALARMQDAIAESARRALALQHSEAARLEAEYEAVAAHKASRAKSEFLATMSHELRTPLNAILGFSEIIRDGLMGPLPRLYANYGRDIFASGSHLLALINDVLDIAKLEAGKVELHESEVDVLRLMEDAVALVKTQAAGAGVAVHARLERCMPSVLADERLLKQVVLNLLSNAVKFTPEGGTVSVIAHASAGLAIKISDTGIGMSEEEVRIALTPFGQIDSKVARRHKGTGLGLPICCTLMALHGGGLDIASTPGKGTTVTISLPQGRIVSASDDKAATRRAFLT